MKPFAGTVATDEATLFRSLRRRCRSGSRDGDESTDPTLTRARFERVSAFCCRPQSQTGAWIPSRSDRKGSATPARPPESREDAGGDATPRRSPVASETKSAPANEGPPAVRDGAAIPEELDEAGQDLLLVGEEGDEKVALPP